MSAKNENAIYKIAQNIMSTKDEDKCNKLLVKLSSKLSESFEQDKIEVIEEAIMKTIDNEELELTNLLLDEIHLEIENIYFENDKKEDYDSTMLIMPCAIVSRDNAKVPSINDFESIIRKHFINNQIIQQEDQFFLGTIRVNQADVDEMTLQDWWEIHRNILEENQLGSDTNQQLIRNKVVPLDSENFITIFYMLPTIINKDDNEEVLNSVVESHVNLEMWDMISEEINDLNSSARFILFPPMTVREGLENSKFIMQGIEFDIFFDEYSGEDNTDIGYMQIEEDPEKYVVLFFDNEDLTLLEYFIYETDGVPDGFISILLEKCVQNPKQNLFSFDSKISLKQLESWSESNEPVDISQLINEANSIDINEAFRLFMINNPTIDGHKKQTIH